MLLQLSCFALAMAMLLVVATATGKKKAQVLLVLLTLLVLPSMSLADNLQPIPEPSTYVVDQVGLLSAQERVNLNNKLEKIRSAGKVHIAVLIVETIGKETIEQYSIRVAEKWKTGTKEKDNGIIFVMARQEKKFRIEVGYGMEPFITDGIAGEIMRSVIFPKLKSSPFTALSKGVDSVVDRVNKGVVTNNDDSSKKEDEPLTTGIGFIDDMPLSAKIITILLGIVVWILFLIPEIGALAAGLALPFVGGAIYSIVVLGFSCFLGISLGALAIGAGLRFGTLFSGGGGSGSFGGGGSSGGY